MGEFWNNSLSLKLRIDKYLNKNRKHLRLPLRFRNKFLPFTQLFLHKHKLSQTWLQGRGKNGGAGEPVTTRGAQVSGTVKIPICTKRAAEGYLHGLTRSSKKKPSCVFSWPSIHLFATLGKQMHFGFPFGGVQRVLRIPQPHGRVNQYSKCDAAHTDSPTPVA